MDWKNNLEENLIQKIEKTEKNRSKIAACEQIRSKKTKINVKIPHANKKKH